ncbi:unnamed protein product [Mytilus edulis]|uniref:Uncharacterized protein n=1 Tax=Mytilus edulis TaxID=6550 RepID=A0A8S3TJ41_MYTED|nr:unnamed protein product [Mytilus edulis]
MYNGKGHKPVNMSEIAIPAKSIFVGERMFFCRRTKQANEFVKTVKQITIGDKYPYTGIHKKTADAVSLQDEDTLWCKGVISVDSAKGLSYGVFYYICKLFDFRDMDEHRDLDATQFEIVTYSVQEKKCLKLYGRVSKNHQGVLFHRKIELKKGIQWKDETNPRDIVNLFSVGLSLIPKACLFFLRPVAKLGLKTSGKPKFSAQLLV